MPNLIEIRENEAEITKIGERSQRVLAADHGIKISNAAGVATIAYVFLKEAIQFVNENKSSEEDVVLNLMQLLDIGVSCRSNEEAEKEGNFTPFARPGQEFKLLVKDDDDTEEAI